MTFNITVFIWVLLIFTTALLYINNFNNDLAGQLVPVVGAILLAMILLVKYILIDPTKIVEREFSVIVLHDQKTGMLYSVSPSEYFAETPSWSQTYGRHEIQNYFDLNNNEHVKFMEMLKTSSRNILSKSQTSIVTNVLAYSIFDWLSLYNFNGWVDDEMVVNPVYISGPKHIYFPTDTNENSQIEMPMFDIPFPKVGSLNYIRGTTISQGKEISMSPASMVQYDIEIKTNAKVTLSIVYHGFGTISGYLKSRVPYIEMIADKKFQHINSDDIILQNFRVKWTLEVCRFRAKSELTGYINKWFNRMTQVNYELYSWDALTKKYFK